MYLMPDFVAANRDLLTMKDEEPITEAERMRDRLQQDALDRWLSGEADRRAAA